MLKFSLAEIGLCGSYIGPQYDYRIVRGKNIRGGQVIFSHFVNSYYFRGCCLHCRKGRKVASFVGKIFKIQPKQKPHYPPPPENYLLYQTPQSHPYSYFIVYHTVWVDSSHASQSERSCGCGEYLTKVWCKG